MRSTSNDWVGLSLSAGRYLVEQKLGEGGMGFVYRAKDRNLDTDVVVKVPRASLLEDPEFASRFAREIRSLVALSHPNIVKITDVGEYEGLPFAVMQYLAGGSLADRYGVDAPGGPAPASPSSLSGWLRQTAAALDFVHKSGFVHRDVKPGNILLDGHGNAYLSDFGVAKALASGLEGTRPGTVSHAVTGAGIVLGTPEYMAPELILGLPFDGRLDQYALAVTVYELLCGRRPFEGPTSTAVLVQQSTQAPPPPETFRPGLGRGLSQVLLRALAKDPAARFPSNAEFARAVLKAVSNTEPGEAQTLRFVCPSCNKSIALKTPSSDALWQLQRRRIACPGCSASLTLSDDARSLRLAAATPAGGTVAVSVPPQVPRTPPGVSSGPVQTVPTQAQAPRATVRQASIQPVETLGLAPRAEVPSAAALAIDLGMAPPALKSSGAPRAAGLRSVRLWTGIGIGAAAAGLVLGIGIFFLSRSRGPRTGEVVISLGPKVAGTRVTLDETDYDPDMLARHIELAVGPHRVVVNRPGFVRTVTQFDVHEGENTPVSILMVPTAPVVPAPDPSPATLASAPSQPEAPATPALGRQSAVMAKNDPAVQPPVWMGNVPPPPPLPGARFDYRAVPVAIAPDAELVPLNGGRYAKDKDTTSLSQVVNAPEHFANRVVTPAGLLVLGTVIQTRIDRLPTFAGCDHEGVYSNALIDPERLNLVLDKKVADGIERLLQRGLLKRSQPVFANRRSTTDPGYPSVPTITVQRMQWQGREYWVGTITRLEMCTEMDPTRIGNRKFVKSFHTVTLEGDQIKDGFGDADEWEARVGPEFIHSLVAASKRAHNMSDLQRRAFLSSQYSAMMNAGASMGAQYDAQQKSDLQRALRPR